MKFEVDEFIGQTGCSLQMQVVEIEDDGYLCWIDQGFSGHHFKVLFSEEHLYESSYN